LTRASICEPHRDYIQAQLRLKRNAIAIYQDLVDQFGFTGAYNSVKRFTAKLRWREPEQFDRLEFSPGEEMQVDYGEGAPTRVLGTTRYRKPRLFVATLRYSRRSFRRVVWKSSQETLGPDCMSRHGATSVGPADTWSWILLPTMADRGCSRSGLLYPLCPKLPNGIEQSRRSISEFNSAAHFDAISAVRVSKGIGLVNRYGLRRGRPESQVL